MTLAAVFAAGRGKRRGGGGGTQGAPPPPDTLLSTGRIGGQAQHLIDFSADALTTDIFKRARNIGTTSGANQYAEATKLVSVDTISRSGTTVTVKLRSAPTAEYVLASGQRCSLTVDGIVVPLDGLGLEADHATITRVSADTFTYQTVTSGTVASYSTLYTEEIPCSIIYSVAVGSDGQPDADCYCVLSTVAGSATKHADLDGTYTLTFEGSVPTVACDGASMSGSGATRTVVVDATDTAFVGFKFTGVNSSFKLPTLVRNDHSAANYLRPDAAQMFSRCKQIRFMDGGRTNLNAYIKSWATRPKIACGLGMPLEDMARMADELSAVPWYCVPDWASNDYITKACEFWRDNSSGKIKLEVSNEVWNEGSFPHFFWSINRAAFRLKAYFHGFGSGSVSNMHNVITSVTKATTLGVTTTTWNLNRPPLFASGTVAALKITDGSTTGYNTPDAGALCTVSGNSISFVGNSGSGTATVNKAVIIGNPSDPLYAVDFITDPRLFSARMHGEKTYQMGQLAIAVLGSRAQIMLCSFEESTFNQENYVFPWLVAQYGALSAWCYGIGGAPYPVVQGKNITVVNTGTETLTSVAHGRVDDEIIYMLESDASTLPAPFVKNVPYFVRNKTADTFQLALTSGGAAINITSTGSSPQWANAAQLAISFGTLMTALDIRTAHIKSVATGYGVKLVAYEFNPSFADTGVTKNTTLIDSLHSSAVGKTMQYDMLNRCLIAGYDEMMLYSNSSIWGATGGGSHWGWLGDQATNKTIGSATDTRLDGHDKRLLEPA